MKKVYIIHRWGGTSDSDWYPWIKEELEDRGFEVIIPEMPDTENPSIEAWVDCIKKEIPHPDKCTYLMGHSIGCQAIMRYLESLPEGTKVGGVLFVAGWFNLKKLESEEEEMIAKPWVQTPIDCEKIKRVVCKLSYLYSDNDPWVDMKESSLFKERLGAKTVFAKEKGHFHMMDSDLILTESLAILR